MILKAQSTNMVIMKSSMDLADDVLCAIKRAIGEKTGFIPLHEPSFIGNEWRYVKDCIDSTFVSSVGAYVDRFEIDLAKKVGSKHAIAVVNGTAALHVGLLLSGVKEGDEVLVPALTFVATGNAVRYCSAIPHFVDSCEDTLGINVDKLRVYLSKNTFMVNSQCVNKSTGRVIRAIIPMHTFGHPVDIEGVMKVANEFGIAVVEDAAESLGSAFKGQSTGTFGTVGIFSFNGNKIITTGGGGAIVTNDSEIAKKAKHITTTAKLPHAWEYSHDMVGFNYRMPNINAALGCAQLENLDLFIESKRSLYSRLFFEFSGISGIRLMTEPKNCKSNYWLQTILLDPSHVHERDAILAHSNNLGFMARPAWNLLSNLEIFSNCPTMDLSEARSLEKRIINIPSSANLKQATVG